LPPGIHKFAPTWIAPLLLTLAALAVRGVALILPTPDADMAVIGLIALHALKGDFSAFFYGESNGGTIESLVAAPLLWLLGPSTEALSLAPALFSLAFLWCAYLACADMWGRRAGLAAMVFAAAPPYFFVWHCVLPRGAYIETALFSLLLIWITFRLVHRSPTPRLYLLYGLVAGLGLWTHFMMLFALAASGLYVLLANWRLLLSRWLLLALGGLLAGGLPLWLFNLANDGESFRFLLARKAGPGVWEVLRAFWSRGVPVVLGVYWDGSTTLMVPYASWGIWALGLAALAWLLWLRRRGIAGLLRFSPERADGAELWLLLAFMVMAVMAATGEPLGSTRRHLVPIYAALIPLAGYAFDQLFRRSQFAAWLLAGLALASNLVGIQVSSPLTNESLRREAQAEMREDASIIKEMLARGLDRAYSLDFWVAPLITFKSGERVLVERPHIDLEHFYEPNQRTVGQTPGSVPFLCEREAGAVGEMLRVMGAAFQVLRDGPYTCFYDLRPHVPALRMLAPEGWRADASHHADDAGLALHHDGLTRWSPLKPQQPGESFVLDLGRVVEDLCLMRLSSGRVDDQPAGLLLETSLDGQSWNTAVKMGAIHWPFYWDAGRPQTGPENPRLDLGFSPRPARFLRLSQTGSSSRTYWSLQHIRLYCAAPAPERPFDPAAAVAAARELGTRHLYADHHLAAFVPRRMRPPLNKPPANPAWPLDLDPRGTLPADLGGVALAVTEADAQGLASFLRGRGMAFGEIPAGGFVVFHHLDRTPVLSPTRRPQDGEATSSRPGGEAAAMDGDPATAWSTGRPRLAGDFFRVDLGRALTLDGLVLDNPAAPTDLARKLRLELSADGQAWRETAWEEVADGPIYFAGDRLLGAQPGRLRLSFAARQVRHLRLSLTGGHQVFHWGIAELGLSVASEP
jgi:hypothetical protein